MHNVTEDQNRRIGRMMQEIKSLIDLRGGSLLDPERVIGGLQHIMKERSPDEGVAISTTLATDWERFYHDLFGLEIDLSTLMVPMKREGFELLIVMAEGITLQGLYDKCSELFPCLSYPHHDDLKGVLSNRSGYNGTYAVWVRDAVEADEKLEYLPTNQLERRRVHGITLEERLLMELKFFKETGCHLDVMGTTFCVGSRYFDNTIPVVKWSLRDRKLYIDWHPTDESLFGPRFRRVVF